MQDIAGVDVGAASGSTLAACRQDARRGTAVRGAESPVSRWAAMAKRPVQVWYKYEAPGSRKPYTRSADRAAWRRSGGEARPSCAGRIADEEILARIMVALANERRARPRGRVRVARGDIDVIYCYGFGFPRHRGGPMFLCRHHGAATVLSKVKEYRAPASATTGNQTAGCWSDSWRRGEVSTPTSACHDTMELSVAAVSAQQTYGLTTESRELMGYNQ